MAQMSHVAALGGPAPVDAGMLEFKECLKRMRDGHPEDALGHARRALGAAPKNPFYLSYTGLLAAMADRRFGDAETLCREALNLKCNHAQLYLNLASPGTDRSKAASAADFPASESPDQSDAGPFAAQIRRTCATVLKVPPS